MDVGIRMQSRMMTREKLADATGEDEDQTVGFPGPSRVVDVDNTTRPSRLEILVDRIVRRYPDRPALEFSGRAWSYQALDSSARHMARLIHESCSDVPARIGLIGTRSPGSYAAYLAILKIGSAVVPISSAAPAERVRTIARLANLDLVLASTQVPAFQDGNEDHRVTLRIHAAV